MKFDGALFDKIEEIMDFVTSDDYVSETGDDYFYQKHADIITNNFDGDWDWCEVIQFWSEEDILTAESIFKQLDNKSVI